jgi:hypothetical protein
MFVTIMRTARISDLRRGHLTAGFVPQLAVRSFHSCDSADCTIVTIERRSPDRLSVYPLYIRVLHALGFVPSRVFLRYRVDNRIRDYSTKNRRVLVSAQVLANHNAVIVAHAQKVELITKSNRKDDRHDARTLARLARIDPELLGPVRHRSAKAQIHLTVIRARAELVSARTALVNAARGLVKSFGQRLPKCGTYQVNEKLAEGLSAELRDVLAPLLREVESLTERIKEYDERMEKIAKEVYPEVSLLQQVKGVGTQIALTYVLTSVP